MERATTLKLNKDIKYLKKRNQKTNNLDGLIKVVSALSDDAKKMNAKNAHDLGKKAFSTIQDNDNILNSILTTPSGTNNTFNDLADSSTSAKRVQNLTISVIKEIVSYVKKNA